jgi:hypothetical protein
MLSEIVRAVLDRQEDIRVVAQLDPPVRLRVAVDQAKADVVIASNEQVEAQGGELLRAHPCVRALAVGDDGRQTVLWRMEPQKIKLGEMSPQTLLKAVRG